MIKPLAFILPLVAAAASAGDLDQYYKPSDKPRWYVAPEEGPLVGTQNFWYVTPHDVDPGGFTMSGQPTDVTGDTFSVRPNSVWGHYTYRVTRLGDEPSTDTQPHERKVISSRELLFSQLGETRDRTLLVHGTITEVFPESKGFKADVAFASGSLPLRFDVPTPVSPSFRSTIGSPTKLTSTRRWSCRWRRRCWTRPARSSSFVTTPRH